ncbi:hydantoinase/oxoprolinase family protein [Amycolatopsis sp. FBCC-B4732]|uniref:hydantoinase/oxoprolinase family protein n=1 Tax=Amycolatopsis sp. FBCC-B4732 TaxID=3079339 RepID=UPI001FF10CD4|nr:hydantoinase/oxoprolinase family protein [Amycolatopsis sp. FBCC-B4732]UOX88755.1 hydantoinase/oxoprolinase family protein [Amycolatopsis sp. FBCC-B4732]
MRIGVDIGGTFTDLCALDDSGIVAVGKVLTTHDEPARAVEEGLAALLADAGITALDVEQVVHGTTLVTNALIERTGSRTALLATAGFRDVLEMRREHRYELYDLHLELPAPLVPRHLRFDVPERILADGSVRTALDEAYVVRLGRELHARGVEAVAVCFLHAFTNPVHERRVAELFAEVAPELRVALSADVVPEIREFERASTTVANVYVQDLTERYLRDLERRLRRLGITRAPHIMLSNGGLATVGTAARYPIRILESGPAGGALAAAAVGPADLLAFDMGGTTAKLCLIAGGAPLVTHQFEVDRKYRLLPGSGLPVQVPVTDMIEIGVGGGSIARIDALGLLTVGPGSAGSEPGPVCYGRGGTEPTVTDADLVLGYLDPGYFLGGGMRLDAETARAVLREKIADPLGVSVEEAAWGIHTSVNEDMANAARVHAVERGHDPAKLPMYTFGGAGPVHGAGVARALGAPSVVAPPAAGVLSAAGFLTAPLAFDFVRSARAAVHDLAWEQVDALFAEMEAEGEALLAKSGVADVTHRRIAEMRYAGQGYEIRVPVRGGSWPGTLIGDFTGTYRALYRRTGPEVGIEVLNWRVVSSGPAPDVTLRLAARAAEGDARKGTRKAYFPAAGGFADTAIFDRYQLGPGTRIDGPAIVEERESTVVVPPGAHCVVREDAALEVTV